MTGTGLPIAALTLLMWSMVGAVLALVAHYWFRSRGCSDQDAPELKRVVRLTSFADDERTRQALRYWPRVDLRSMCGPDDPNHGNAFERRAAACRDTVGCCQSIGMPRGLDDPQRGTVNAGGSPDATHRGNSARLRPVEQLDRDAIIAVRLRFAGVNAWLQSTVLGGSSRPL